MNTCQEREKSQEMGDWRDQGFLKLRVESLMLLLGHIFLLKNVQRDFLNLIDPPFYGLENMHIYSMELELTLIPF